MPTGGVTPAGGGTAFNGGTITGALTVAPAVNTLSELLSVIAPAGYDANSPTGHMVSVTDENGMNFRLTNGGSAVLQAPAGEGQAALSVQQVDGVGTHATLLQSTDGIAVYSDTGRFQLINSANTATRFRVNADGSIVTAAHAAPADGDLIAGECALWFDQSNGAAKLMVKGKSANGTVVAASIALS